VSNGGDGRSMQEQMPQQYEELIQVCDKLELHFKDMQDIEFTIEEGKLYSIKCLVASSFKASALILNILFNFS
jgi:pyruvate,orthophosphate dikinase